MEEPTRRARCSSLTTRSPPSSRAAARATSCSRSSAGCPSSSVTRLPSPLVTTNDGPTGAAPCAVHECISKLGPASRTPISEPVGRARHAPFSKSASEGLLSETGQESPPATTLDGHSSLRRDATCDTAEYGSANTRKPGRARSSPPSSKVLNDGMRLSLTTKGVIAVSAGNVPAMSERPGSWSNSLPAPMACPSTPIKIRAESLRAISSEKEWRESACS